MERQVQEAKNKQAAEEAAAAALARKEELDARAARKAVRKQFVAE